MFLLAQIPALNPSNGAMPQLPPLPAGPSLESVRGPIEAGGFNTTQVVHAAVIGGLIGAGLIWFYLRKKRSVEIPANPQEVALAELKAAEASSDNERFAITCANAIRHFLEARYKLPVATKTSSEATKLLPLPGDRKEKINEFLATCDGIKFAQQALSEEKRIELSDTAKKLIRELDRKAASTGT